MTSATRLKKDDWKSLEGPASAEGIWDHWPIGDRLVAREFSLIEEYLHEVAHAVAVRGVLKKNFTARTGTRFDRLNDIEPKIALVHELQALAVEKHMLSSLGCLKYVNMLSLTRYIWKRGLSGAALPWPMCRSLYHQFLRSTYTREAAAVGVRFVLRVVEEQTKKAKKKKVRNARR